MHRNNVVQLFILIAQSCYQHLENKYNRPRRRGFPDQNCKMLLFLVTGPKKHDFQQSGPSLLYFEPFEGEAKPPTFQPTGAPY